MRAQANDTHEKDGGENSIRIMMCQACGQALATRRDFLGREVCGRVAHKVVKQTKKSRKEATALARYVKEQERAEEKDDSTFAEAKTLLKRMLWG